LSGERKTHGKAARDGLAYEIHSILGQPVEDLEEDEDRKPSNEDRVEF
jgi:hypothetical protein